MTAFTDIEARINTAVDSHLSNAVADFGSGVVVNAHFEQDYGDPLGIAEGSAKVLSVTASAVTVVAVGNSVTVNGTTYTIAALDPVSAGVRRLRLK